MTRILIPTRVRYGFAGGVGEVIRMLGAVAPECGHSMIDLDGGAIPDRFPSRSRKPRIVLARRLSHLRTLLFFDSAFPAGPLVFFQTSLAPNSLLRDMAYMSRCCRTGRPFSVFVHGWDEHFARSLSRSSSRRMKLVELLNHAGRIFVLSPTFADTLNVWGVDSRRISVETTMVDDTILSNFDVEKKINARTPMHGLKILFMSRVVREKGIYQAIRAFQLHKIRFPSSTLMIAGDGKELAAVKKKVYSESIPGVDFCGYVEGSQKAALLADSDVFLFPSFHGEGLPISLLEAMAFGNTIISRPVGGIRNLLRVPEMGYLEPSLEPEPYAALLDRVAEDPESWRATARFNHEYSVQNTLASRVSRRIFSEVTSGFDEGTD